MTVDAERLLSAWLRNRPAVQAIVADRVYTELPATPTFPSIRLTLIDGEPTAPTWQPSLHHHADHVQIECYGGPKKQARDLEDTVSAELAAGIVGVHDLGAVTGVTFGQRPYVPDDTFNPPRPRYIRDVTLYTRP